MFSSNVIATNVSGQLDEQILHQANSENEQNYQNKISYWEKKLDDLNFVRLLPDLESNTAGLYSRGDQLHFYLNNTIINNCEAVAKEFNTSLSNVILTCVFLLLHRYTSESDICLGVATSKDDHSPQDLSSAVNNNNYLPIRIEIPKEITFANLLAQITQNYAKDLQNELQFSDLLNKVLNLKTNSENNTVLPFNIAVKFNSEQTPLNFVNTVCSKATEINLQLTKIDFHLNFNIQNENACEVGVEFNANIFKPQTLEIFIERLQVLLLNLRVNLNKDITQISIQSEKEQKILTQYHQNRNKPSSPYDFFHLRFLRIAEENPEKIAIAFHKENGEFQQITYKQLDRITNSLAAYLQNINIGPEKTVGICLSRSINLVIAIIAVLKVGGVLVTMESDAKDEATQTRIAHKIKDALIDTMLVDTTTQALFANYKKSLFCLNIDDVAYRKVRRELGLQYEPPELTPENLAYIMYTSGTTGVPKGVMITQGPFANLADAIDDRNLPKFSNTLCTAPATFDASLWEILEWLSTRGGQLHLINEKQRLSAPIIEKIIQENNIHTATLLPEIIKNLSPENIPCLKDVITMGSSAHKPTLDNWYSQRLVTGGDVRNEYGITEGTICNTENKYDPSKSVNNIGKPLRNTGMLILNENLQESPIGIPGKIYLSGRCLARGYVGNDTLTKKAFPLLSYNPVLQRYQIVEDAMDVELTTHSSHKMTARKLRKRKKLATTPEERDVKKIKYTLDNNLQKPTRFYATNDRGRYVFDKEIAIEFLGREDDQIKVNGNRIEISGLRFVLSQFSSIQDVFVTPNESKDAVIAYIVPKPNQVINKETLDDYLKTTSIPFLGWPRTIFLLKEMPLTKNGKINTKALPSTSIIPFNPQASLREQLIAIWSSVLKTSQIDINKTFCAHGGGIHDAS